MNAINKTYTGVVYLIVNTQDNKKYVGQTVRDLDSRIKEHFKPSSSCIKLKQAINKYGKDSFKVRTLKAFSCSDEETLHKQLDYWEIWYIAYYDSYKNGYNCTTGGQFFDKSLSEEIRKKQSISLKKAYSNPELRKRMSELNKGRKNSLGHKHTPETIEKMKKAQSNRSEETRKKLSLSASKRRFPERYKAINQYDLDGNFIKRFESVSAVKKELGTKANHFCDVANGKRKSAYGYFWRW